MPIFKGVQGSDGTIVGIAFPEPLEKQPRKMTNFTVTKVENGWILEKIGYYNDGRGSRFVFQKSDQLADFIRDTLRPPAKPAAPKAAPKVDAKTKAKRS